MLEARCVTDMNKDYALLKIGEVDQKVIDIIEKKKSTFRKVALEDKQAV